MHIKHYILLSFITLSFSVEAQKNELVPLFDNISDKYGYVYTSDSTKFIIKPRFKYAYKYGRNFATVCIDSLYTIINKKGGFVFKPRYKFLSDARHSMILAQDDSIFYLTNIYGEPIFEIDAYSVNWTKEIISKIKDYDFKDAELTRRVLSMYPDRETKAVEFFKLLVVYEPLQNMILFYFYLKIDEMLTEDELKKVFTKSYKYTKRQYLDYYKY